MSAAKGYDPVLRGLKESLMETRPIAAAKAVAPVRPSKLLGYVRDPEPFFAEQKQRIWDKVGDLSGFRVTSNRILVAMWTTEEEYRTPGGILIHSPDKTKDENKWQGRSALVLKLGPLAFMSDDAVHFEPDEIPKVGDWVLCRPSDGLRIELWHQECVVLESERGIRAILDRPDAVW